MVPRICAGAGVEGLNLNSLLAGSVDHAGTEPHYIDDGPDARPSRYSPQHPARGLHDVVRVGVGFEIADRLDSGPAARGFNDESRREDFGVLPCSRAVHAKAENGAGPSQAVPFVPSLDRRLDPGERDYRVFFRGRELAEDAALEYSRGFAPLEPALIYPYLADPACVERFLERDVTSQPVLIACLPFVDSVERAHRLAWR